MNFPLIANVVVFAVLLFALAQTGLIAFLYSNGMGYNQKII
jgi:hypothetical protein